MFEKLTELMGRHNDDNHDALKQIIMTIITEGTWHRESYANDIAKSILKEFVVIDKNQLKETIIKLKARGN